jgi:hypothetical protein
MFIATTTIVYGGIVGGEGAAEEQVLSAESQGSASAAGAEAASVESAGWVRVGRWMRQEELSAMQSEGVAQESRALGGSRVTLPANPDAYKDAPSGSVYVEYDIPSGVTKPAGSGWARIPGPNSVEGRAAASAGRPLPQMPPVKNIEVVKAK